jgi:hypothetical protein
MLSHRRGNLTVMTFYSFPCVCDSNGMVKFSSARTSFFFFHFTFFKLQHDSALTRPSSCNILLEIKMHSKITSGVNKMVDESKMVYTIPIKSVGG